MDEFLEALARHQDPGPEQLPEFMAAVAALLDEVLNGDHAGAFWEAFPELRGLAADAFESDVSPALSELAAVAPRIPAEQLRRHGLVGRAARFKYGAMAAVTRVWRRAGSHLTIRAGFRRVIGAIDAHLDSLIAASGGVGGVVKEFKDAILSLAPEK